MSSLVVCLFGRFKVTRDGVSLPGFEVGKVQELLSYLLLNRQRPHSREALATLLWADYCTSQARRYLSKALWQLQSALAEADAATANCTLLCEPDWIQFNNQAVLKLDVADFEDAVALANGTVGHALDPITAQKLHNALAYYQGDLLEGCYEDWCIYERERLQCNYITTLNKLMQYCEVQGEYETGQQYGFRILACDRAREQAHRQLMKLHYLAGDRTGALRQYEQCKSILQTELGVAPSHSTQLLYEKICNDHLPASPVAKNSDSSSATDFLQQLLVKVRRLQATASEVEQYLEKQITTTKP